MINCFAEIKSSIQELLLRTKPESFSARIVIPIELPLKSVDAAHELENWITETDNQKQLVK